MKKPFLAVSLMVLSALVAAAPVFSAEPETQDGWRPLFNGRDLTGWRPLNVAPDTFRVRDGIIVSTGIPTGMLRTDRQYENFELELEWRHLKSGGNAGVFLWSDPLPPPGTPFPRGMEVQVLDNGFNLAGKNEWYTTQGDVFPVQGATMTPTGRISKTGQRSFPIEDRSKSSPEWNHYRLVATNGVIRLSVNGREVTVGKDCKPRKGYLCLESEGSECHFRNLRIRELPSTNPRPEETANLAEGFVPLYSGVDLRGWKTETGHQGHWQPKDWILAYDGRSEAEDKNLWTQREFGDFVLVCDWRWTRKPAKTLLPVLLPNGDEAVGADGKPKQEEVLNGGDSGIYLRGSSKSQVNIWCWPVGSGEVYGYRTDRSMPPEVRAAVTPKKRADKPVGQWNRFIITMRGDRLAVNLNGETVIENAQLPGVPARGPLALQHHGDPIEFANLFIRELPIQKPAPRIAMLWSSVRGDASLEAMAKHDLVMVGQSTLGLKLNQQLAGLADGFTPESIEVARAKVKRIRELNPGVLILGDFFYLFSDSTSHQHDWYAEYDRRIGQALGPGERVSSHVWTRRYEQAMVVVNLPGAKESFTLNLENRAKDSLTGDEGTSFVIAPGDGRILLTP